LILRLLDNFRRNDTTNYLSNQKEQLNPNFVRYIKKNFLMTTQYHSVNKLISKLVKEKERKLPVRVSKQEKEIICDYCSKDIPKGKGFRSFVKEKELRFCSVECFALSKKFKKKD